MKAADVKSRQDKSESSVCEEFHFHVRFSSFVFCTSQWYFIYVCDVEGSGWMSIISFVQWPWQRRHYSVEMLCLECVFIFIYFCFWIHTICTHVLLFTSSPLRMFSFDEFSEFLALPEEPWDPCELFLDGPSRPGERDSEVGTELGPESDRLKNFWLGDCGVPSRESLSLDSRLEIFGWIIVPAISFSGVCGRVGHSWSSTYITSLAISVT